MTPAFSKPLAILAPIAGAAIAAEVLLLSGAHVHSGHAIISYGRFVLRPY